ncbi:MAG: carboxypeptidase M32 [Planctomycetes bacterium]|nr:carboxypeptidase M32 [Planctomycetota bacterium]
MNPTYEKLLTRLKELHHLGSISGLVSWDQETYMPPKAGADRAEQLALLSSLIHQRLISDEMGELLETLRAPAESGELGAEAAVNVRELRRTYARKKKLPTELVEEISRTRSLAQQAWVKARQASDFPLFKPWLEKTVELQRQVAVLYGYKQDIYDALIEDYEPGMTVAELDPIFAEIRSRTVPLVAAIVRSGRRPDRAILSRRYPIEQQKAFGMEIARAMGFDFEAGRLDTSAHPFCSGLTVRDVRMTTRYRETDPLSSLYGIMHESGHGLYDQGFDPRHAGTPMAEAVSLGIHESQSRLWENLVGRSRAFWTFALPRFKAAFPGIAGDLDLDTITWAVNEVTPSLIRVEADEVTYNLHILLRFELERDLLNGRVQVSDLPGIWSDRMAAYLGLRPPDDARGVLQDIHWSFGLFGYFPTYTLGNLYGDQFFETARRDLPDMDDRVARGDFQPLREWLREKIHSQGMRYKAKELVERVTGKPPASDAFLNYMERKFGELYGV